MLGSPQLLYNLIPCLDINTQTEKKSEGIIGKEYPYKMHYDDMLFICSETTGVGFGSEKATSYKKTQYSHRSEEN